MDALKLAEEKELEEKRRIAEENAGIDWGMGKPQNLIILRITEHLNLKARTLTRRRTSLKILSLARPMRNSTWRIRRRL
jgi:hypothetical protein